MAVLHGPLSSRQVINAGYQQLGMGQRGRGDRLYCPLWPPKLHSISSFLSLIDHIGSRAVNHAGCPLINIAPRLLLRANAS